LQPFAWDPLLADLDRALHGGHHPWEWLQPVLGRPHITALINGGYHLWFGVTYGVLLWQMVDIRRPKLRMRYLLTFALLWILIGNVGAVLFSSAGPVYYGRVTGLADPFAPLMAYLHQANETVSVPALAVQDLLWRAYSNSGAFIGGGISAMPSMHLASTFSFVLLGAATARWLGAVFAAFALLILVGSVHLGWHYAIDGYVAIVMAWVVWHAVGWLLDRRAVERLLWGDEGWPPDAAAGSDRPADLRVADAA
jgi:PAP2 superfamily